MITILHIVTHFDLGGAERVAANICNTNAPDIQYHIVEVTRARGRFSNTFTRELEGKGIAIHRAPKFCVSNKLSIILFPIWFTLLACRLKPRIIHTHTEVPDLSVWLWYKIVGRFFRKIEYVRTIHNTELWNSWKSIGARVESFFKEKKSNIAISTSTQECYLNAYGEVPPIIHNGLEILEQKPFDGIIPGKINILFASRFEYQKGIVELIQVVNALKDNEQIVFHIVGNGSMKTDVETLGNLKNVRIYDKIFGLASYLSSFDFLFMPSNFEGLGLMSIEASYAKLPTIINNCLGLKETLPSDWELSVNDNCVKDFLYMFRNIETYDRTALGNKAFAFVQKHFCLELMQKEYETEYRRRTMSKLCNKNTCKEYFS